MSTQLSHKVSSLSTKKKARAPLASKLPPGSAKQVELVSSRISHGVCVECGSEDRVDGRDFCVKCLSVFPKRTDVGTPFDAWQFFVIQIKPAIPGLMVFAIWREGVYERKAKPEYVTYADSFKEAEAIVQKKRDRAFASAW